MRMKEVIVDVRKKKAEVRNSDSVGPIDFALRRHDELKSHDCDVYNPRNALCFGGGQLLQYNIPGTHRLITAARSPLWTGFYISSMGGFAINLAYAGINYISVESKGKKFSLIGIKGEKGRVTTKFIEVKKEQLDDIYFRGFGGQRGLWAVQNYAYEALKRWYGGSKFRVIATGPASLYSRMGCLCSTVISNDRFQFGQDDFAGRGGLGSLMVQGHRVFAVVVGGNNEVKSFDKAKLDKIYAKTGKKPAQAWKDATEKYRYIPDLKTGGTYGVNFTKLQDKCLMFNWKSSFMTRKSRQKIYERLIRPGILEPFNREVIETKSWFNCGEPCPGVCKKRHITKKIDYEPYSSAGPNMGVFNFRDVESVVHRIDTLGFDAIEFGTIASWILECLDNGLLKSTDFFLDVETTFDPEKFMKKAGEYSCKNALFIRHLAYMVVARDGIGEAVAEGMRIGARKLDKMFKDRLKGKSFKDFAVYLAHGKDGSLAPSQYWAPGLFAPIPLPHLSKTYYKMDIWDPVELGKGIAKRYVTELGIDELGICRFHRGWAEKVGGDLMMEVSGIDLEDHARGLGRRILDYNKKAGAQPVFWESRRVKDIIYNYLIDFNSISPNKELGNWVHRFGNSLNVNARKYWSKIRDSFEAAV